MASLMSSIFLVFMQKHENRASSLVNLQNTKQGPSYFVSVFLGLLAVSYYSTTRMPVGWSNAWLPPAKCCTWNTRCHYPATRALGTQFVEKTCASHKPLPFSRGQWSCMHTAASLQTVFGLFHLCADHLMVTETQSYGEQVNALSSSGR